MVKECELTWQDIFVPKPDGQKPVRRRASRSERANLQPFPPIASLSQRAKASRQPTHPTPRPAFTPEIL
jgi:hypothetical protein